MNERGSPRLFPLGLGLAPPPEPPPEPCAVWPIRPPGALIRRALIRRASSKPSSAARRRPPQAASSKSPTTQPSVARRLSTMWTAPISTLGFVADGMRQRQLDRVIGEARSLVAPVGKSRSEPVDGDVGPQPPQRPEHRSVGDWRTGLGGRREHPVTLSRQRRQQLDGAIGQGHRCSRPAFMRVAGRSRSPRRRRSRPTAPRSLRRSSPRSGR